MEKVAVSFQITPHEHPYHRYVFRNRTISRRSALNRARSHVFFPAANERGRETFSGTRYHRRDSGNELGNGHLETRREAVRCRHPQCRMRHIFLVRSDDGGRYRTNDIDESNGKYSVRPDNHPPSLETTDHYLNRKLRGEKLVLWWRSIPSVKIRFPGISRSTEKRMETRANPSHQPKNRSDGIFWQ